MKKLFIAMSCLLGIALSCLAAEAATISGSVKWDWKPVPGTVLMRDESAGNGATGLGFEIRERRHKGREPISARLELIDADLNPAKFTEEEIKAWYRDDAPPEGSRVYFARTDKKNRYEFTEVPAGTYYLAAFAPLDSVWLSPSAAMRELAEFLPDYEQFVLFVRRADGMEVLKVTVEDDSTVYADFDFPNESFTVKNKTK